MHTAQQKYLDEFTAAYIDCALWCGVWPTEPDPVDLDYEAYSDELTPDTLATMRADCADFLSEMQPILERAEITAESAGHDFWLTRNRHGAGFWDRGYSAAIGQELIDAAHAYGECNLFRLEDGSIICE